MDKITKSLIAIVSILIFVYGMRFAANDSEPASDSITNSIEVQSSDTSQSASKNAEDIPINTLADFNNAIVNIAERANPTVVTVTTTQTVTQQQRHPFSFFFDDPRFDQEREFQRSGLGSGVIVSSEDGYIITNNHVIENADEIRVQLYSGEEMDAEIVGTDPASDVAVLKIDANNLQAIPLGDSDRMRVGDMVLAIGSPLRSELAHTVSQGIVSASGRSYLGLNQFENYIQTDAAINPGNSGGALVNLNGELVGINTAIASRSGGNQGIGFAIPINMVKSVMDALITDGRVTRGFLGLSHGGDVDRTMARALGMDTPQGFVVGDVVEDGPAAEAGFEEGDVIVEWNGEEVRDWNEFRAMVANTPPGTDVDVNIFRDGDRRTLTVEVGEMDPEEIAGEVESDEREELRENLGFDVENLDDNIRNQLRLQSEVQGVVVMQINQTSNAYRQGLQRGDIITQVAGERIENTDQFYSAISAFTETGEDAVLLRVNRQGNNMYVAFEL
ncbi:MAG: Do family serine endopeptidase [Balneolaceae bacterium]